MNVVSENGGYALLAVFAIAMIAITYWFARWRSWDTREGFLVANRNVNWLLGGASIAASWIWAPALFVSVQMAYQKGLAGIFWFTFPNILALAVFALLAPKIRERMPEGYTFPQYIRQRSGSERLHKVFLVPHFFYQLMAVTVQIYAGGSLLSMLTGIPLTILMPALLLVALTYTLISGLVATVVTDFVHLAMIFVIGAIIIPWTTIAAGGFPAVSAGLHGVDNIASVFDPGVAFSFGVVTSIGLISGAISDQQYWQRAFAIRKHELRKAYVFGSLLFGLVPISISVLGFLAANPSLQIKLPANVDTALIGVQTIAQLLPSWAVVLFVIMVLGGLSSSLDSGLSATSSLWVTDVCKEQTGHEVIKSARKAMLGISLSGLVVALSIQYIPGLGLKQLWWVFNAIAACVVVPTVLSLYWDNLSERGAFWGIVVAFSVGLPLFIWANINDQPIWVVASSLFIIFVSTVLCVVLKSPPKPAVL
jgi:Na+/proline symporter